MERLSKMLALAIDAERAGKPQVAHALVLQVLAQAPEDDRAWLLLGGLVNDAEGARACLERAISLNPNNALARRELERHCAALHRAEAEAEAKAKADVQAQADAEARSWRSRAPRLGEHLVKHYGVDWTAVMRAVIRQRALGDRDRRPLGELLVEMGVADRAKVELALREQRALAATAT